MNKNASIKLVTIKSLIVPKLPKDFHKSLFFSEIEYQKYPNKKLRNQLINLYIQGIDYYNIQNQKDLSLYFQTKLLDIMKGGIDYFEKRVEKEFEENKIDINNYIEEQMQSCFDQEKKIDVNINNVLEENLKEQKEQLFEKIKSKKKLLKFKRINSVNIKRKTLQNSLKFKSTKTKGHIKRVSADINFELISNNKNKNSNPIFSKIENALNNLDRINTLLIIEYTKKLKKHMKNEFQKMDETMNKYNEYIKSKNQLYLIYDSIDDKNEDDAKNIKEQIDSVVKEWEEFKLKNSKYDNKNNKIVEFDNNNLDDFVDNLYKKLEEIKSDNKL